jgi:hypothetical protein
MRMRLKRHRQFNGAAFTVTELMVAVSLMSLIVIALYAMFNQTQKALRANEAQVDINERGRGLLELVSRELESARVSLRPDVTNLWITVPGGTGIQQGDLTAQSTTVPRLNIFDATFYLAKANKAWRGVGYMVMESTNDGPKEFLIRPRGGVGTLYRYETPETNALTGEHWDYAVASTNLFRKFHNRAPVISGNAYQVDTNSPFGHIADGVVHFRLTPYDTKGRQMTARPPGATPEEMRALADPTYRVARVDPLSGQMLPDPFSSYELGTNISFANVILQEHPLNSAETIASFRSNALPAYLELELGVLDPVTLKQYKQLLEDGQIPQAQTFLSKRIANVQIFRKRIPLRTVAQ